MRHMEEQRRSGYSIRTTMEGMQEMKEEKKTNEKDDFDKLWRNKIKDIEKKSVNQEK